MNREMIKGAISLIGSGCAGHVIEKLVKQVVTCNTKTEKWITRIGAFVIGGLLSNKAADYIDAEIDEVYSIIDKITKSKDDVEVKAIEEE